MFWVVLGHCGNVSSFPFWFALCGCSPGSWDQVGVVSFRFFVRSRLTGRLCRHLYSSALWRSSTKIRRFWGGLGATRTSTKSRFVSFSPFLCLFYLLFEGLYVLWSGGGCVKRVLGYLVVLRTLWKVEILGNRSLGRCWGGPGARGQGLGARGPGPGARGQGPEAWALAFSCVSSLRNQLC